jgi:hypothetical protein
MDMKFNSKIDEKEFWEQMGEINIILIMINK